MNYSLYLHLKVEEFTAVKQENSKNFIAPYKYKNFNIPK